MLTETIEVGELAHGRRRGIEKKTQLRTPRNTDISGRPKVPEHVRKGRVWELEENPGRCGSLG